MTPELSNVLVIFVWLVIGAISIGAIAYTISVIYAARMIKKMQKRIDRDFKRF